MSERRKRKRKGVPFMLYQMDVYVYVCVVGGGRLCMLGRGCSLWVNDEERRGREEGRY